MAILDILHIDKKKYELKQRGKLKNQCLYFEFHGIDAPEVGDYIDLDEKLLDRKYEGYAQPYSFEFFAESKNQNDNLFYDEETLILHKKNKNYILKRIYG